VRLNTPSGQVTEYPVGGSASKLVSGPDGNLWFAYGLPTKIVRFDPRTSAKTEFTVPADYAFPNDLIFGTDGELWFTIGSGSGMAFGRLTSTGLFTNYNFPRSGNTGAHDLTIGADGLIWFKGVGGVIGKLSNPTEFSLEGSRMFARENVGTFQVVISRTGNFDGSARVDFRTRIIGAATQQDFASVVGTLNFAPTDRSLVIEIPIVDDALQEPLEHLELS
jgi:hypothetical protein